MVDWLRDLFNSEKRRKSSSHAAEDRQSRALYHHLSLFEQLISEIATEFINLPYQEIDAGIEMALGRVCSFIRADRGYVYLFSAPQSTVADLAYEWHRPGVRPMSAIIPDKQIKVVPWWREKLERGEIINIPSFTPLPPEARIGIESLQSGDVKAAVAVPIVLKATVLGYLGADSSTEPRAWDSSTLPVLKLVGYVFANAIERRRIETERKQAVDALRESEARYRRIFNNAPLGIFHFDRKSKIIDCNDIFISIIGSSRDQLIGFNMLEAIQDEQMLAAIHDTVAHGSGYYEGEYQSVTANKTTPVRVILSRVSTAAEQEWSAIGIVEDITERKQAEEILRRTQKLESLGLLAGGIAHDFNNLLVAMMGQTSLALAKISPDDPGQPHVEKAAGAARRAADLTRQLLAYSGQGQFKMGTVNLNQLIEDNLHLIHVAIPKQVSLRSNLFPDLPFIVGDIGQLQQVIMNLIINAAESIANKPGQVQVTTGVTTIGAEDSYFWSYTTRPLEPGRYVVLTVADSGSGMEEETLGRIFDPFFTTKFTGRGLGLAAVLGIVQGHGGGLSVDSEPGVGTTFKIIFPMSQQIPSFTEAAEMAETAESPEAGLILVIDDEEMVRTAISDVLHSHGFVTITAAEGKSGVELFTRHLSDIELVLLDLSMPGMSGSEALVRLREIDPDKPIIISSGYSQQEVFEAISNFETIIFLQKPYNADRLINTIHQTLSGNQPL